MTEQTQPEQTQPEQTQPEQTQPEEERSRPPGRAWRQVLRSRTALAMAITALAFGGAGFAGGYAVGGQDDGDRTRPTREWGFPGDMNPPPGQGQPGQGQGQGESGQGDWGGPSVTPPEDQGDSTQESPDLDGDGQPDDSQSS